MKFLHPGLFRLIAILRVHHFFFVKSVGCCKQLENQMRVELAFAYFRKLLLELFLSCENYPLLSCNWKIKWERNWVLLVFWEFFGKILLINYSYAGLFGLTALFSSPSLLFRRFSLENLCTAAKLPLENKLRNWLYFLKILARYFSILWKISLPLYLYFLQLFFICQERA